MKPKDKPARNLTGKLPPNPLPLPGQPLDVMPTVELKGLRIPTRMKPGEIPLADDHGQFVMPWYLMWPD